MVFPVFFDANVLYGSYLNDLLLRLAERGVFRPLWSEAVIEELEKNLIKGIRDVDAQEARIERVQQALRAFPDALVTGYEPLVASMTNDPKDRHVLAAAVFSQADILLTFNLSDFPKPSTQKFTIEIRHPDHFLLDQLDLHSRITQDVIFDLLQIYKHPRLNLEELMERYVRSGVPRFASTFLRKVSDDRPFSML